ncbi:MAG: hypothetical protein ABI222_11305, partial [Opitutaceae bacterium]
RLTCLVYQATSTTNDIPLLFFGAVWVYGRWRWRRESRPVHLFWMVLALGFMAGTKTTGVLCAGVLAAVMLWDLRHHRVLARRVLAGLFVAFLLMGSVEKYLETARIYHHPLGPKTLVRQLKNPDGWKGGVANLSRYIAGSVYVGPITSGDPRNVTTVLQAERSFLAWSGLT